MRHERIPIEQKLRGDKCEPCTPAHGMGLNESHAPERVSMNAASTSVSALRNGSGNEMEWLMGEGMDDPLSSLLHMEQEAQGGTGDFGTLGDDLFGMPAPSGIFADNAGGARGGVPVKRDDPPPVEGVRVPTPPSPPSPHPSFAVRSPPCPSRPPPSSRRFHR